MFPNKPLEIGLLSLCLGFSVPALAADMFGPVKADVVRVIDGDTVLVDARPWPNQRIRTYVRLRGIDSAEVNSSCAAFRQSAHEAKQALVAMMTDHHTVTLTSISGDKYFGRVVATLMTESGTDLAKELLQRGLAEPYQGKRKARPVCPD